VIPATGKPFPYDSLCGNKSFTFSTKGVLGHSNVWIMLAGIIAISGGGFYFIKKRGGIYQGLPVSKQDK
jgi:LPXTG-motif cell wall-anchored protein